ncbi:MAG: hypothetical protein JXR96_05650 [Deltaproteobacteria bacterium]|nr:hypothetical protein [Deltaproteobacteria bacterium]
MARLKTEDRSDKLYLIVEKLRTYPKENSRNKKMYNFSDPTALRALRIHRHLRALETDILESRENGKHSVSLQADPDSDQIILSIQNRELHCCRVAYLSPYEFQLLRKNRKVASVLRKCPAYKDVA